MAIKKEIIVVVGLPASGKSTVAEILKKKRFHIVEFGDVNRELMKKNNIPREHTAMREFSDYLRKKEGKAVYAKHVVTKLRGATKRTAIMGARSTYEVDYLRSHIRKLYVIAVMAPLKQRFNRLLKRHKQEDPRTMKGFKWLEMREKRGFMKAKSEERHGVMRVIEDADYIIENTGTVGNLKKNVEIVLKDIDRAL